MFFFSEPRIKPELNFSFNRTRYHLSRVRIYSRDSIWWLWTSLRLRVIQPEWCWVWAARLLVSCSSESSGLSFRLKKSENVTLSDWSFNVSNKCSCTLVKEKNLNLGNTTSWSYKMKKKKLVLCVPHHFDWQCLSWYIFKKLIAANTKNFF